MKDVPPRVCERGTKDCVVAIHADGEYVRRCRVEEPKPKLRFKTAEELAEDAKAASEEIQEAWPEDIAARTFVQAYEGLQAARAFLDATETGDAQRTRVALQGIASMCEVVKAAANALRVAT